MPPAERAVSPLATSGPPPKKKRPKRAVNSGEVASGLEVSSGIPNIEYLNELDFPSYIQEFRRVENDPAVARGLRSNTLPITVGDWMVEPASDDARDEMIAGLVGANLYQQENDYFGREYWCRTPWTNRLRDALRMLSMGFAMFQKLYRVQGRFTVFDKFKYIMPESISKWYFNELDELIYVERQFIGADGQAHTLEPLDASEIFIYTWDQEGANILGKPLIRPAWMDFNIKTKAKKLGIIDKQKTAVGVPFFQTGPDDGVEDKRRADQIAKAMRSGRYENLWARIGPGQDFGWKEGGNSTKGLPEIVRQSNEEIAGLLGDKVLDLGTGGAGGSRGVSGTQAAIGAVVQTGIVRIVEMFERMLAREIVDFNWPTGSVVKYPTPKSPDVDPYEKTRTLPDIMANVGTGKAITKTRDTENEIRRRYKLMEIEEEEYDELNQAPSEIPVPGATEGGPEGDDDSPGPSDGGEDGDTAGEEAEGPDRRQENVRAHNEKFKMRVALGMRRAIASNVIAQSGIDVIALRRDLERFESVYYATLSHVQKDMRSAVVQNVRSGRLVPRRVTDVKVPFVDELRDRLLSSLKSVRDYGRERIEEELKAQLVHLARRPVPNPTTRRGAMAFSNDQARVTAELDVTNLVGRLQAQTVDEYNRIVGEGGSSNDLANGLEAYFDSITDRQILDMARTSTPKAFNQGRHVGILEFKSQLGDFAIRVEVDPDDPNTCEPCQQLNGARFRIGSQGYLSNQPPAHCLGKLRCRGFFVVEAKEMAA